MSTATLPADTIRARIERKLTAGLSPETLIIRDDSHRHAHHGPRMAALGGHDGHAPLDAGGETHFSLEIVATAFAGLDRVARHRLVHDLLADELRDRVHALKLRTRTPEEAAEALSPAD